MLRPRLWARAPDSPQQTDPRIAQEVQPPPRSLFGYQLKPVADPGLIDLFEGWKGPAATEHFGVRFIQTDSMIPTGCDGDAIDPAVLTATEMQGIRTIFIRCGADGVVAVHARVV